MKERREQKKKYSQRASEEFVEDAEAIDHD
jgi:hypothetical protein